MNDEERDGLLARLVGVPTQERELILQDAQLIDPDRRELEGLVNAADALWLSAQGAPALEDDPVAAMLGLVPDGECRLDPPTLSRARKQAHLSVSDLAGRLQQRGWDFDKADVFRWETRTAADVPPAVVQAVAEILNTSVDNLISVATIDSQPDRLSAVREHPRFEQLVKRWAQVRRVPHAVAAAALESRMLATVHRGEHPDAEQLLQSLDALVTSVEQTERE